VHIAASHELMTAPSWNYDRRNRSDRHFAWQQTSGLNVRFGSLADIEVSPPDVRFTPKSGHAIGVPRTVKDVTDLQFEP
jgi:hypothetical protein